MLDNLLYQDEDEKKHENDEYHLCRNGKCKCLTIWKKSWDAPLCTITHGVWGDTYPDFKVEQDEGICHTATIIPFTNMVEYGAIEQKDATEEAIFVTKALNNYKILTQHLDDYISLLAQNVIDIGGCDHDAGICICDIYKKLDDAKELRDKLKC